MNIPSRARRKHVQLSIVWTEIAWRIKESMETKIVLVAGHLSSQVELAVHHHCVGNLKRRN
jgi:hypothetical protein